MLNMLKCVLFSTLVISSILAIGTFRVVVKLVDRTDMTNLVEFKNNIITFIESNNS